MHDHTPREGGVVAMSGPYHVEALARRDGGLRFWVTDFARTAVPLDGVRARAIVRLGARTEEVPLVLRDGALEGRAASLGGDESEVRFEAVLPDRGERDGQRLMIDFTLPLVAP